MNYLNKALDTFNTAIVSSTYARTRTRTRTASTHTRTRASGGGRYTHTPTLPPDTHTPALPRSPRPHAPPSPSRPTLALTRPQVLRLLHDVHDHRLDDHV